VSCQHRANRLSTRTGKWRYACLPTPNHVASIEDPFNAATNCAQCVSPQGLSLIQRRFQEANRVVSRLQPSPSGLHTSCEFSKLYFLEKVLLAQRGGGTAEGGGRRRACPVLSDLNLCFHLAVWRRNCGRIILGHQMLCHQMRLISTKGSSWAA